MRKKTLRTKFMCALLSLVFLASILHVDLPAEAKATTASIPVSIGGQTYNVTPGQWVTVNTPGGSTSYNVRFVNGKPVALEMSQYQQILFGETAKVTNTAKTTTSSTSTASSGKMNWNEFQSAYKGSGLSKADLSQAYNNYKADTTGTALAPVKQSSTTTTQSSNTSAKASSATTSTTSASGKMSWNEFQSAYKGSGLTKAELSQAYNNYKADTTGTALAPVKQQSSSSTSQTGKTTSSSTSQTSKTTSSSASQTGKTTSSSASQTGKTTSNTTSQSAQQVEQSAKAQQQAAKAQQQAAKAEAKAQQQTAKVQQQTAKAQQQAAKAQQQAAKAEAKAQQQTAKVQQQTAKAEQQAAKAQQQAAKAEAKSQQQAAKAQQQTAKTQAKAAKVEAKAQQQAAKAEVKASQEIAKNQAKTSSSTSQSATSESATQAKQSNWDPAKHPRDPQTGKFISHEEAVARGLMDPADANIKSNGTSSETAQSGKTTSAEVAQTTNESASQTSGGKTKVSVGDKFKSGYQTGKAMTNQGFQNVKDSLKSGFSAKNILVTAGITVGVDLATQIMRGEQPSLKKALSLVCSAEFVGGMAGATLGAAAGSFFTPFLSAIPVVGGVLSALAPTFGSIVGSSVGAYCAGDLKNGRFSIKEAFKRIDWVGVAGQTIGSTAGAALGSCLGPVGTVIGGMVGGYLGNWAAHKIAGLFGKGEANLPTITMPVGTSTNGGTTTVTGGVVIGGNDVTGITISDEVVPESTTTTASEEVEDNNTQTVVDISGTDIDEAYAEYARYMTLYQDLIVQQRYDEAQEAVQKANEAKAKFDALRNQSNAE